jgi:hypothetical protein
MSKTLFPVEPSIKSAIALICDECGVCQDGKMLFAFISSGKFSRAWDEKQTFCVKCAATQFNWRWPFKAMKINV